MHSQDKVTIRAIEPSDAEAVTELFRQLGYSSSIADVRERLKTRCGKEKANAFVAAHLGTLVGVLVINVIDPLHEPGRWAILSALVVSESVRGSGIGAQLLRKAEICAWDMGCTHVELSSNEARIQAHQFYERHGYKEVRKRFVKHKLAVTSYADAPIRR